MKFVKKLTALFLAVCMVMAMGISVAAAQVTVTDNSGLTGHTYAAYKVFAGTQAENDTTGKLAVTGWGTDVDGANLLSALKSNDAFKVDKTGAAAETNIFAACTDAKSVAEILANFANKSDVAKAFAKVAYANKTGNGTELTTGTAMELEPGYYLIVDETTLADDSDDVLNTALLQVTKDGKMTIEKKNEKPSVEKKVKENNKYTGSSDYTAGYNDVADYNIGDSVPFQLIGTVPNIESYTVYSYTFNDTLDKTFDAPSKDSIKVWLSSDKKHNASDGDVDITKDFNITVNSSSKSIIITVAAKVEKNQTTNEYTLKGLKSISSINQKGGQYIIVDYSATLNSSAVIGLDGNVNKVDLTYSNNPNQGGEGETGKTPEDKVIVFTYELDVTKVDGGSKQPDGSYTTKLKDAEFRLYSDSGCEKEIEVIYDTTLGAYRPVKAGETATVMTSAENTGLFAIKGLDDGTYYLKETKAPSGYNLLANPIKLVISATTENDQKWDGTASKALTAIKINVNDAKDADNNTKWDGGNVNNGSVSLTVENKSGSVLPSTGGMGTTVIYIAGIALIVAAGVVVIARKRMS